MFLLIYFAPMLLKVIKFGCFLSVITINGQRRSVIIIPETRIVRGSWDLSVGLKASLIGDNARWYSSSKGD